MVFEIILTDETTERAEADGYALEGPLTTFFRSEPGRTPRLDPWAVRLLSIRTDRIARIANLDPHAADRLDGAGRIEGAVPHWGPGLRVV